MAAGSDTTSVILVITGVTRLAARAGLHRMSQTKRLEQFQGRFRDGKDLDVVLEIVAFHGRRAALAARAHALFRGPYDTQWAYFGLAIVLGEQRMRLRDYLRPND